MAFSYSLSNSAYDRNLIAGPSTPYGAFPDGPVPYGATPRSVTSSAAAYRGIPDGVVANLERQLQPQYVRKRLIFITWQDDDASCKMQYPRIKELFCNHLCFDSCELCIIPKRSKAEAGKWLEKELEDFVSNRQNDGNDEDDEDEDEDDEDESGHSDKDKPEVVNTDEKELLVVFYSGHGSKGKEGILYMHDRRSPTQSLPWNRLQNRVILGSPQDVLVILECCHADQGTLGASDSRKDFIVACDADLTTPTPRNGSFTNRLISAAMLFVKERRKFTPIDLRDRMITLKSSVVIENGWPDPIWRTKTPDVGHDIYFVPALATPGGTPNLLGTTPPPGSAIPVGNGQKVVSVDKVLPQGSVSYQASAYRYISQNSRLPAFDTRSSSFYQRGRVFVVLWHESAGAGSVSGLFTQHRYFIVLKPVSQDSSCTLAINGRHGRSVTTQRQRFGAVYVGASTSASLSHGRGMVARPIRIVPSERNSILHPEAQIDYSKPVLFEHGMKVQDFGLVHPQSMNDFLRSFQAVQQWCQSSAAQVDTSQSSIDSEEPSKPSRNQHGDGLTALQQQFLSAVARLQKSGEPRDKAVTIAAKRLEEVSGMPQARVVEIAKAALEVQRSQAAAYTLMGPAHDDSDDSESSEAASEAEYSDAGER